MTTCTGDHAAPSPRGRFGASVSSFGTQLGGGDYALSATSIATSVEIAVAEGSTLQLVTGELLSGSLRYLEGTSWSMDPGFVVGVGYAKRFWSDPGTGLFLLGTASVSYSSSRVSAGPVRAADARVGVVWGRSFGPFTPYLLARGFGGPVSVPDPAAGPGGARTVGDTHHYVLGLGASLRLGPVDVGGEVAPLGERRLTGTAGVSF